MILSSLLPGRHAPAPHAPPAGGRRHPLRWLLGLAARELLALTDRDNPAPPLQHASITFYCSKRRGRRHR